MGCSITLVQNPPTDPLSSISSDDLQESEVSLLWIHDDVAQLKINVEKQKEHYPEDNTPAVQHWINCQSISLRSSKQSDTYSKKSCLKSQSVTPPHSQHTNTKKVHFVQPKKKNKQSQNGTKKKNKKKLSRWSEQPQQRINLDDIF
ncbi:unnamed protein product (macronuclear) [Paramecium tetraurelia]|uniref:Uncharacterized protein n=1 Tax=Paramecium tetraurelia TaxID=5888 RepID=A0E6Q4_PARTE|nr:uncharacterized protein GSPATT00023699001 [Paramecium tetraurelia]CAK90971.1 unnamed protein product [Paramecium tetraurelia]|eukprot:XP_001458368.1 hypothetical protein (macronuclear) [Paramecium tetraurelia strain d4-2]